MKTNAISKIIIMLTIMILGFFNFEATMLAIGVNWLWWRLDNEV